MAQTQHTPGPWVAMRDPNGVLPDDFVIGCEGGEIDGVATCSERDARVIEAAPDMLAALRLCEGVLGRLSPHHPGALNAFNAAFAAIAMAEGSTNA